MPLSKKSLFKTSFSHCYPDITNTSRVAESRIDFGRWVHGAVQYSDVFNIRKYDYLYGDSVINDNYRTDFLGAQWGGYGWNGGHSYIDLGSTNWCDCVPISLSDFHFSLLRHRKHGNYNLSRIQNLHTTLRTALEGYGVGYNQQPSSKRQFTGHNFLYNPNVLSHSAPIGVSVPVEIDVRGFSSSYNTGNIVLSGQGDLSTPVLDATIPALSAAQSRYISHINPSAKQSHTWFDNSPGWSARGSNIFTLHLGSEDINDIDTRDAENVGCELKVSVYGTGNSNTSEEIIPDNTRYLYPYTSSNVDGREFAVKVSLLEKSLDPWYQAEIIEQDGSEDNTSSYTFIMSDVEPTTTSKLNFNHVIPVEWRWGLEYSTYNRSITSVNSFHYHGNSPRDPGVISVGRSQGSTTNLPLTGDPSLQLDQDSNFTIELYVRHREGIGSAGADICYIGKDNNNPVRIHRNGNRNQIYIRIGDIETYIPDDIIKNRQWNHIAITHSSTDLCKVYVNGTIYKHYDDQDINIPTYYQANGWRFRTNTAATAGKTSLSIPLSDALLTLGDSYSSIDTTGTASYRARLPYTGDVTGLVVTNGIKYVADFDNQFNEVDSPSYITPIKIPQSNNTGGGLTIILQLDPTTLTDISSNNLDIKQYGRVDTNTFLPVYNLISGIVLEMEGLGQGFKLDVLGTEADTSNISSNQYSSSVRKIKLDKDKFGQAAEFTIPNRALPLKRLLEKRLNAGDTKSIVSLRSIPAMRYNNPVFSASSPESSILSNGDYTLSTTSSPGLGLGIDSTIPIMGNISVDTVSGEITAGETANAYTICTVPSLIHTFKPVLEVNNITGTSKFTQQVTSTAADATLDDRFGTGPDQTVLTDSTGSITYTISGDYVVGTDGDDLKTNNTIAINMGICNAWRGASAPYHIEADNNVFDVELGDIPVHAGVTIPGTTTLENTQHVSISIDSA